MITSRTLTTFLLAWTLLSGCGDAASNRADGATDTAARGSADGSGDDATGRSADSGRLRVLTFNVLCSFCAKPEHDPWKARVPYLQALIGDHDADIIGLQELTPSSYDQPMDAADEPSLMVAKHPVYVALYYKSIRTDAAFPDYPDATLYLRKSRFELLEQGTYWLGPKPDEPYSGGFKSASFHRLVVWARVRDKHSGAELYVANTHFDNGSPNQTKSAPLLLSRLPAERAARDRAIVMGDFNSDPSTQAFKTLTSARADGARLRESHDLAATISIRHDGAAKPAYDAGKRIDHIFVGGAFTVSRWTVDMRRFGPHDRYPSDHFPIAADLEL